MTRIGARDDGTTNFTYLYMKVGAKTGANNIVVSFTGTGNFFVTATSYSGGATSGQPDNSTTGGTANGTGFTGSLTPVASNCWIVLAAWNNSSSMSAGTGSTLRGTATVLNIFDSNGAVTAGSPYSMGVSWSGAHDYAYIMASLAPVAVASTAHLLGTMGVGS